MSEFKVHDVESAPEAARDTLEKVEEKFGFVPNLMGIMAAAPPALKAYVTLSGLLEQTTFSPVEQQILMLAISRENECGYCMPAHTVAAKAAGMPDEVIDTLRAGRKLSDSRLEALRHFAVQVVDSRGHPSDSELKAFQGAGYRQRQVLEVILAVGMKTLSNYTNHIAETPLDDAFSEVEWEKTG